MLASWVLIPAISLFGDGLTARCFPATKAHPRHDPAEIWKSYILYIGAGAVATGGIISLCQALPTIFVLAQVRHRRHPRGGIAKAAGPEGLRTDDDLPNSVVVIGSLILVLAMRRRRASASASASRAFWARS